MEDSLRLVLLTLLLVCGAACSGTRGEPVGSSACGTHEDCADELPVPGGRFLRSNEANFPAKVADFRLGKHEVSVSRFREFSTDLEHWRGSGHPAPGEGANPKVPNSGWQASWPLPSMEAELRQIVNCDRTRQTWTDEAGAREKYPMNCVNWYLAFAFCSWANSRLPTEAEWNYAAAGGDEQRRYPWGNEDPGQDTALAVYGCYGKLGPLCDVKALREVGSANLGDARWGHADLAGNVWEWVFDANSEYTAECDNCAATEGNGNRIFRGGSFYNISVYLLSGNRVDSDPAGRSQDFGFRCAKSAAR